MSKWLVLPLIVVAYIATSVTAASPRDRDHDRPPDRRERQHQLSTKFRSAGRDPDHARLNNRPELRLRTHPRRAFPSPATTGVPGGWTPARTVSADMTINTPGAVVQDILFTSGADIVVNAPNVTIRRVKLQGGVITTNLNNPVIEDTTLEPPPGQFSVATDYPAIGEGGYTARRVKILRYGEGFRGSNAPIRVEDSFVFIHPSTQRTGCAGDLHSDGYQSYGAKGATFINNTMVFSTDCGSSPYYAGYGGKDPSVPTINTGRYNVDRLLVENGGYPFRQQTPGSVTGLRIVNKSWAFGPIDNRCSVISPWEAKIVTIDSTYQVTRVVRNQPCNTEVVE